VAKDYVKRVNEQQANQPKIILPGECI
jgi:hypothetical protein